MENNKNEISKIHIKQRALNNELKCRGATMQLLYSLAVGGVLSEPFRSWAVGFKTEEGEDLKKYNDVIQDISESILGFHDDVKSYGHIMCDDE